ncbi:hypothetical protein LEP1GSC108_0717 [Leptospira weilii str. UI 13098]|uniref:Uncharacterized protein n=1 Tax=Leptospira weilii str. UI 13098 TaxID=1088542 RepID=M6PXR2_9LEPT|nr:hypothetical protein LEP1GSC108_0717 [Leptospira weilii str. UI 13098]
MVSKLLRATFFVCDLFLRNSIGKIRRTEYKDFIRKSRNIINGERRPKMRVPFDRNS